MRLFLMMTALCGLFALTGCEPTVQEEAQDVREAQQEAAEDIADERQDVIDAQREGSEEIREEQQDVEEAVEDAQNDNDPATP